MKPEQFIREFGVDKARDVVECAPEGAEFYHKDNNEYVKNIDQNHLEQSQAEPKESHLVNFDSSSSEGLVENAAWIEYINVLIDISDLKRLMDSVEIINQAGGYEVVKTAISKYRASGDMVTLSSLEKRLKDHESIYVGEDEAKN